MIRLSLLLVLLTAFVAGCGGVKPRKLEVPQASALKEATDILNRYAETGQVASEVDSFPNIIERLKEEDAAKADIVEAAFKKIEANHRSAKSVATETLKKLQ